MEDYSTANFSFFLPFSPKRRIDLSTFRLTVDVTDEISPTSQKVIGMGVCIAFKYQRLMR